MRFAPHFHPDRKKCDPKMKSVPITKQCTLAALRLQVRFKTAGPRAISTAIETWLTPNTADPLGGPWPALCVRAWNLMMAKSSLEWLQAVTCTRGGHRETKSIQVQSETLSRSDKKGEEANVQEFALLALRTKMNGAEGLFFSFGSGKRVTEVIDRCVNTPNPNRHSRNC